MINIKPFIGAVVLIIISPLVLIGWCLAQAFILLDELMGNK